MNKEQTLALWAQGKDAWNAWAKEMLKRRAEMERDGTWIVTRGHLGAIEAGNQLTSEWMAAAEANFADFVFQWQGDFVKFCFPGLADFRQCTFKMQSNFREAIFFGTADFENVIFENDGVFPDARFKQDARLYTAKFKGQAFFAGAIFYKSAKFAFTSFEETAQFYGAKFKKSSFLSASFKGLANFAETEFKQLADFNEAEFLEIAYFMDAKFQQDARFSQTHFGGYASFFRAEFRGEANFEAAQVERAFTLEAARFVEVPDFIQAHFEEAPRLDNVFIPEVRGVARFAFPGLPGIDAVAGTSARYRALKRLAIEAHDHTREQNYFANELKALRGHPDSLLPCPLNLLRKDEKGQRLPWLPGGLRGTTRYWFGLGYEALSDFGRSMIRPLIWWVLGAAGFAWLYLDRAGSPDRCAAGSGEPWRAALGLSIRKALPFTGIASSEKLNQIYACLYGVHDGIEPGRITPMIPDAVDYLGMVQLVLSLLLLFLFLLAVRGHFRIR